MFSEGLAQLACPSLLVTGKSLFCILYPVRFAFHCYQPKSHVLTMTKDCYLHSERHRGRNGRKSQGYMWPSFRRWPVTIHRPSLPYYVGDREWYIRVWAVVFLNNSFFTLSSASVRPKLTHQAERKLGPESSHKTRSTSLDMWVRNKPQLCHATEMRSSTLLY